MCHLIAQAVMTDQNHSGETFARVTGQMSRDLKPRNCQLMYFCKLFWHGIERVETVD